MTKDQKRMYWLHTQARAKRAILHYGGKCVECGYDDSRAALTFHHKDPKTKEHEPCQLINSRKRWTEVVKELDKCLLLCSNCHREVHSWGTRNWKERDYQAEYYELREKLYPQ